MVEEITSFKGKYAFLSNFYYNSSTPVPYRGLIYPTAEHAYQAQKTLDPSERHAFSLIKTPGLAKTAGRTVRLRPDWDALKIGVMYEVLVAKFSHPTLRALLDATGSARLIEGNTWGDRFWGKVDGGGQNWLGRLLERVRSEGMAA